MTDPAGPGVAIIVPMFDVEPYVADCVRSILDQDLADVEVVLVDDASTDGTAEVALAAAGQHPAVRLLRKAQGGPGPGSARNAGLDATTAPLVLFCDGDDLLAPGAVAALRQALDGTGAELACGAAEQFPQPRTWPWSEYFVGDQTRVGTIEDFPQLVHNAAVGNKLFRRELLTRGGLRFAERIHHQDTYVSVPALLDARTLAVVPAVVQRYRKRDAADSIMDAHFTRVGNYWDHLQVVEHLAALRPACPRSGWPCSTPSWCAASRASRCGPPRCSRPASSPTSTGERAPSTGTSRSTPSAPGRTPRPIALPTAP